MNIYLSKKKRGEKLLQAIQTAILEWVEPEQKRQMGRQ